MASSFVGSFVELQLSRAGSAGVFGYIVEVDPASATLTIRDPHTRRLSRIARADIADLTIFSQPPEALGGAGGRLSAEEARAVQDAQAMVRDPSVAGSATGSSSDLEQQQQQQQPLSSPALAGPGLDALRRPGAGSRQASSASSVGAPAAVPPAPAPEALPPPPAQIAPPKQSKAKKAKAPSAASGSARDGAPSAPQSSASGAGAAAESYQEDFDFDANLGRFDKKKIWDEIRVSTQVLWLSSASL